MTSKFEHDSSLLGVDTEQALYFKCKYCLRSLSSRQNLREHLYIHTGEKPYVCTEVGCGQKFRQGSLLSIHKRIHSEIKNGRKVASNGKKSQYPKLTELMQIANNSVDFTLKPHEKDDWMTKIGQRDFVFALKYFNQYH